MAAAVEADSVGVADSDGVASEILEEVDVEGVGVASALLVVEELRATTMIASRTIPTMTAATTLFEDDFFAATGAAGAAATIGAGVDATFFTGAEEFPSGTAGISTGAKTGAETEEARVFFAIVFLAADFLAGAFLADFLATAFLATAFLTVAFLTVAFFTADFLAGAFLATAFFTLAFLATAFLAETFFAVAFLATAFLATTFLAEDFFATAFLATAFLATLFFATATCELLELGRSCTNGKYWGDFARASIAFTSDI